MQGSDGQLLEQTLREAGKVALEFFNSGTRTWAKKDGTPVSDADLAVDNLLKCKLGEARPGYGWLSEETADDSERLSMRRVWVVDPIDGTRSFIEKRNEWCISAALVEDGRPIVARVFRPLDDAMYGAEPGRGARLNGKPIRISNATHLNGARLVARKRLLAPKRWVRPWPDVEIGSSVSLALRLCLVAEASFDGTIVLGRKCEWDVAAGDLIVREAGGRVTDMKGNRFSYNNGDSRFGYGLVAGTPKVHDALLAMMAYFKG